MDRKFFHGALTPTAVAGQLLAEFNRVNLRAQAMGGDEKMIVQIATRPGAMSGGETALTVTIDSAPDGVMVQMGEQAWVGTAASLGWTALTALRNPLSLFGRIDDIAQDIENLQLTENIWKAVARAAQAVGASHKLSERLSRVTCAYCLTANPVGEPSCIACGAPLGNSQPVMCGNCGFVVLRGESVCPNCGEKV